MANKILIILQLILLANSLLAQFCQSCTGKKSSDCIRCSSCEVRRISPLPCYNTNDLVIVLDASGSIGSSNFEKAKSFVDILAAAYNKQTTSRVSFITFSNTVSIVVPLNNTLTPAELSNSILNAPYEASITNTNLGIDAAVAELTPPRTVPRNIVVLTDGESTNPEATSDSVEAAISKGIRTFSVGIGSGVNQSELLSIANGNVNRVFETDNFDDLVTLLNPLSRALCTP